MPCAIVFSLTAVTCHPSPPLFSPLPQPSLLVLSNSDLFPHLLHSRLLKLKGLDQEVKTLKKTITQLKKELKENEEEAVRQREAHQKELETVRETCRREVQAARRTTPTGEGVESAGERQEEPLYEEVSPGAVPCGESLPSTHKVGDHETSICI